MTILIEKISSEEFAGAFRWLRSLDPLYQAEIGEVREWDVKTLAFGCPCHCPSCAENDVVKIVQTFAITAKEAAENVEDELEAGWIVEGVRVLGSNGGFFDYDNLLGAQ